ncbi:GNAT family N-acetyltransferase [Streptomyces sp. NPDC008159]|uniref:GNAT family N-acetyltransferase n=1 Tax=Streptomyces sp. NPDC008159 TaxID=3364817 RepID=UPI0036EA4AA6
MQGEYVSLRPINGKQDYELIAQWSSSVASVYSSGGQTFTTADEMEALVARHGITYLMVVDRSGEPVGGVTYQQLTYPGNFEVGNVVGSPELWGIGYGMESMHLLLDHLFHQRNAHRVHLMAGLYNKQMVQIFLKGPIKVEGILRDFFFLDGEYHDALVGSLLRNEYYGFLRSLGTSPADLIPKDDKADARDLLAEALDKVNDILPARTNGGETRADIADTSF